MSCDCPAPSTTSTGGGGGEIIGHFCVEYSSSGSPKAGASWKPCIQSSPSSCWSTSTCSPQFPGQPQLWC